MSRIVVLAAVAAGALLLTPPDRAAASEANVAALCREAGALGFTGGSAAPAQLYGSFGPGSTQKWDVSSGAPVGEKTDMELVTALPNGTTVILWGKGPNSPGEGTMTVECSTGWGCFDSSEPAKGWESGIIFNAAFAGGADYVFCHMFERTTRIENGKEQEVLRIWENGWVLGEPHTCPSALSDAMAGKGSSAGVVHYMKVPYTGRGVPLAGRETWTCEGAKGGIVSDVNDPPAGRD